MPVPPRILTIHPIVIIGMDVVKVNDISFLSTISRVVKFVSATELLHAKTVSIVHPLLIIVNIYIVRGFKTLSIATDYAFKVICHNEKFKQTIHLNTTSEDEHEPFINTFNHSLKEWYRICYSTLPFLKILR